MKLDYVGNGKVYLIAGGGKIYTDTAAKFCRTTSDVEKIMTSKTNKAILKSIVESNHTAALEFDDFIFGVEGFARVTEVQLVRKRHASYMISSGRDEKDGKREMSVVIPPSIKGLTTLHELNLNKLSFVATRNDDTDFNISANDLIGEVAKSQNLTLTPYYDFSTMDILEIIEEWYNIGVLENIAEEDLRYIKPQATEFKACVKMNAAALKDWAKIRMCHRAQSEIRDLCCKMIALAMDAAPDLFTGVGASCVVYGYCTEGEQCKELKGIVPTKKQALAYIAKNRMDILAQ